MSAERPLAVFLMGPTASGKTGLAARLVARLPCDIISVDSAMVYRGMDIGTAKPSEEVLRGAPHRLIDILDPVQSYSAARFRIDALREMTNITRQGRIPLLVGGTMLYYRALEQGLTDLPGADESVRAALEDEARRLGWQALHERLQRIDPKTARHIHPNDPQRIQRALEVFMLCGRTMSELNENKVKNKLPYHVLKIALVEPERNVLHKRIEARFAEMLERGFLAEVERLRERGDLHEDLPAMRAVGYRQLWAFLEGRCTFEEAVNKGIIASRQLAKRQMTWLRSEEGLHVLSSGPEKNMTKALKLITGATIY